MEILKNLPIVLVILAACGQNHQKSTDNAGYSSQQPIDSTEMTNNFYDNTETYSLPVKELTVKGEISNPGKVDFSGLPKRSLIVKETLLDPSGSDRFTGAYRYDGYSLFDILEKRIPQKANAEEFSPIIDMFVEIENAKGEKVVFSWGEIYYPSNLHRIIIASDMSRIVPSKTKDLWELPAESRIIAGNDLITERNISSPVKITVRSFPLSFSVMKGMAPMYSEDIRITDHGKPVGKISDLPPDAVKVAFNTIFYGRGRGIHSTEPFEGPMLKNMLTGYFPSDREKLREGLICISAMDGYRCTLSYSELFNRNDQQEFLLIKTAGKEDGGLFRIFPACDFFSDRAVKSVSEIHFCICRP